MGCLELKPQNKCARLEADTSCISSVSRTCCRMCHLAVFKSCGRWSFTWLPEHNVYILLKAYILDSHRFAL